MLVPEPLVEPLDVDGDDELDSLDDVELPEDDAPSVVLPAGDLLPSAEPPRLSVR